MSDYEKMRLENIKRNSEFFAGLNLSQVIDPEFFKQLRFVLVGMSWFNCQIAL